MLNFIGKLPLIYWFKACGDIIGDCALEVLWVWWIDGSSWVVQAFCIKIAGFFKVVFTHLGMLCIDFGLCEVRKCNKKLTFLDGKNNRILLWSRSYSSISESRFLKSAIGVIAGLVREFSFLIRSSLLLLWRSPRLMKWMYWRSHFWVMHTSV